MNAPVRYHSFETGRAAFAAHKSELEKRGIRLPGIMAYLPENYRADYNLAMDEMTSLGMDSQFALSTSPNSAIPAILTTMIDPEVIEILFAANKAAAIIGEQQKGSWIDDSIMFSIVEFEGEVSSYGDRANNGHVGVNMNWPWRQSYHFQVIEEYGERELERAGLAKINYVSEMDRAAGSVLAKYQNLTYFFGVAGLQNYGLINDPSLSAALTPGLKAYGGTKWVVNGQIVATANEIFADIQALFQQLTVQSAGLIDAETAVTLAIATNLQIALTATNSFNVNVSDLLKKNFPNIKIETAVQYNALTSLNPQGVAAGNMVQMIATSVEGQKTGFAAFTEKLRAHPIVTDLSSWRQKKSGGVWGTVIKQPFAIASMVGL
jgi:hypothetical protein